MLNLVSAINKQEKLKVGFNEAFESLSDAIEAKNNNSYSHIFKLLQEK